MRLRQNRNVNGGEPLTQFSAVQASLFLLTNAHHNLRIFTSSSKLARSRERYYPYFGRKKERSVVAILSLEIKIRPLSLTLTLSTLSLTFSLDLDSGPELAIIINLTQNMSILVLLMVKQMICYPVLIKWVIGDWVRKVGLLNRS